MRPRIGVEHQVLVRPLEIERVGEGLPDSNVLELRAPGVDHPGLHAGGPLVRDALALDAAILDRGEVVARRPDARRELLAERVALGGETFEGGVAVAVVVIPQHVEIELTAGDRQVGAPPILDPFEFHITALFELADLVGA